MASTEWWVMQVVVPKGGEVTDRVKAAVDAGLLDVVNGDVCRAVELFVGSKAQEQACGLMSRLAATTPGATFKTVMSTDDL